MTARLDTFIAELGTELRPVRRLRSPVLRACGWLAVLAGAALVLAEFADLHAMAYRLSVVPDMWLAVLGSTLTTVLAAMAAFELSLPDRKVLWALLPVPGLVLWIGATGMGCLRGWLIGDMHTASLVEARTCFTFIVSLSLPLSAVLIVMIRRACPLRPNLTAVVCGLAVAAGSATLLNFFHPYDAGATDIAVHVVAITIVVGLNRFLGGSLLRANSFSPRMLPRR